MEHTNRPNETSAESTTSNGTGLNLPEEQLKELAVDVLRTIYDPEIPVNIYDLGLIYDISIRDGSIVDVAMTLTTPACPVAGSLPGEVEQKLRQTPGIADAKVELTWDPPWDYHNLSDEIKLQLGLL